MINKNPIHYRNNSCKHIIGRFRPSKPKDFKIESVTCNLLNVIGYRRFRLWSLLISLMPFAILEDIWCMVTLFGIVKIDIKEKSFT